MRSARMRSALLRIHPDANGTSAATRWTNFRYQLTFITFTRPSNILRLAPLVREIDPQYAPRALLVGASSVAGQPLRLLEAIWHGRRISRTRIEDPPVFIIGHWRSGTTHLHNMFSQDPAFGYVSMYQAIVPDFSLIGRRWLKPLLARVIPPKRPMDNMFWLADSPQEEEIPLAKTCPYSFYTLLLFPRRARDLFAKYVLLEGMPDRAVAEFKSKYYRMLQIATLHAAGRRLVVKNPLNTARVRVLLDLFPDAKFVHIYRSPYDVFSSTRYLHRQTMAFTTLQKLEMRNSEETVFLLYEAMMRRFFAERALIPEGNLAEVRFEDLERDPLEEMRRVYGRLGLPSFADVEPALRHYIASQTSYRKNRFELAAEDRERIGRRWAFAFAELGYPLE
jgi:hypothetical protein